MHRVEFDAMVEQVNTRVVRDIDASQAFADVMTTPANRAKLVNVVTKVGLVQDASLSLAGGALRHMVGCSNLPVIMPVNARVRTLEDVKRVRLAPCLEILRRYPAARLDKPDIDLYVGGIDMSKVQQIVDDCGLESTLYQSSGEVDVLQISGDNGGATITDSAKSWHNQPPWPMYGFSAALSVSDPDKPAFHLDISAARLYSYPLETPQIWLYKPDDPRRVAAAGRAVLWSMTALNPEGKLLPLPFDQTRQCFVETASTVAPLIRSASTDLVSEAQYRGGLRDWSLAMSLIETCDGPWTGERGEFYGQISSAFWSGRLTTSLPR